MATYIQEKMPRVNSNDTAGSVKSLYKYIESLNEQLSYIFGNLGGDNFNAQEMTNFVANLGATNIITQTIISNSVVTKSLYAERGDIAQLTVDWLSTSKKVMKYLNGDTSDDDYIEAHEQGIELKNASVVMSGDTPLTEPLIDRYGNALYWQKDISYAEIINGFPYVNGKQVYMDTAVTDYPVRVYKYAVATNMRIDFEEESGENVPKLKFGDGNNGTSEIFKSYEGLLLNYYTSADGSLQQVKLTDSGVFINGVNVANLGGSFVTDETLTFKDGVLSVNTANVVEADNTLPVTSAAVNTTVGNIEALLETI